jgi:type VI protein secretion system component VasF
MELFRLDWVAVTNGLFLVAGIGLFVGYLCLCTVSSENGFRLRDAGRRLATLTEQRERQAMAMLSAQSLGNVDREAQAMGFVPVQKVQYVNAAAGAVAMR